MNKRFGLIFLILLSNQAMKNFCFSQDLKNDVAIQAGKGILIRLGGDIPGENSSLNKVHYYIIERKELKKSSWKKIAKVSGSKTIEDFRNKVSLLSNILGTNVNFTDRNLQHYWKIITATSYTDSLGSAALSFHILFAAGTLFIDTTASVKTSYQYKITPFDFTGNKMNEVVTNDVSFTGKKDFAAVLFFESSKMNDMINVKWKFKNGLLPDDYRIYRQTDIKLPFSRLDIQGNFISDKQNQYFYFMDDLTENNYARYYMIPVDALGNTGKATDTVLVSSLNRRDLQLPSYINTHVNQLNGAVILSWKFPSLNNIRMISVYRSTFMDSLFARIADLSPNDTTFTDFFTGPDQKYYYYLTTTGFLNETSYPSVTVFAIAENKTKPDRPVGLKSIATSHGIKLVWKAGDPIISGYYVFRGQGKGGKMIQVSYLVKAIENIANFRDTSMTLRGNKIYTYAVCAVSKSNVLSDFSDTLSIRPNVPTEPESPRNITSVQKSDGIHIIWDDATEFQDDVMGYEVFRSEPGSNKSFCLNKEVIPFKINYFTDTTAEYGKTYIYWVLTQDLFGVQSKQGKTTVISIEEPPLQSPPSVQVYQTPNGITIEWEEVLLPNVSGYKIYRFQRGEKPLWLTTLEKDRTSFVDNHTEKGQLYFYYVTTVSKSGKESLPGKEASIRR